MTKYILLIAAASSVSALSQVIEEVMVEVRGGGAQYTCPSNLRLTGTICMDGNVVECNEPSMPARVIDICYYPDTQCQELTVEETTGWNTGTAYTVAECLPLRPQQYTCPSNLRLTGTICMNGDVVECNGPSMPAKMVDRCSYPHTKCQEATVEESTGWNTGTAYTVAECLPLRSEVCRAGSSWYGPGRYCSNNKILDCSTPGTEGRIVDNCYGGNCVEVPEPRFKRTVPAGTINFIICEKPGLQCISDDLYDCNYAGQENPHRQQHCAFGCSTQQSRCNHMGPDDYTIEAVCTF